MREIYSLKLTMTIAISLVLSLILSVWPLPIWLWWFKPPWVLITLIYWVMFNPKRINVGVAFLLGLLVDGMSDSLLGIHAFAFVCITYLMCDWRRPLRKLSRTQQSIMVFALACAYQFILFVLQAMMGSTPWGWHFWLPSLLTLPLWFLLSPLFSRYCAQHQEQMV